MSNYFDQFILLNPLAVEYMQQIFNFLDTETNMFIYQNNLDYLIFNDDLKKKFFNLLLNTSKELTQIILNKNHPNESILSSENLDYYKTPSDYYDFFSD